MKFSERSFKAMEGVHPDLVKVMNGSVCHSPCDFTVVWGVRTVEQQRQLYAQGRTTKGIIVTTRDGVVRKSNHQVKPDGYGYAVDIYPFYDGKVHVAGKQVIDRLKLITDHIKSTASFLGIKISCGIDWKRPYDPPHIELIK